jgi:uncharacterized protein YkwD
MLRDRVVRIEAGIFVLVIAAIVVLLASTGKAASPNHNVPSQQSPQTAATIQTVHHAKPKKTPKHPPTHPSTRQNLLKRINKQRQERGIRPLKESPALDKSAQAKSADEAAKHYFAHNCPGCLDGLAAAETNIGHQGYAGETLYEGTAAYATPKAAASGWMHSPPHRHILLDPNYTSAGFGIAKSADGTAYFTAHFFGSPQF